MEEQKSKWFFYFPEVPSDDEEILTSRDPSAGFQVVRIIGGTGLLGALLSSFVKWQ